MLSAAVPGRRGDRTRCLDRIHAALKVSAGRNGAAALAKMLRGVASAIGATNLRVELTPDGRRLSRRPSTRVLARDAGAAECSRPLAVGGRRLGVLYARYSRGCPTRDDQSRLALAAQELAVAVDRVAAQALGHIGRHRMDEVIGMLAHELRTPLAAIGSAMEILARPGGDAGLLQQAREVAERQVRYQASLLDGLVDLTRIAQGTIELRRTGVDLKRVIAAAIEVAMPSITQRHQALTVSVPDERLLSIGDEIRLQQVIVNLLANATKYTRVGGRISVRAGRAGDAAVIRVKDSGAGIPPTMLQRVFEPFVQAPRRTRGGEPGGLGVGLALVKRLVEAHGGTVEARSAGRRRGSEFIVRLPRPDAGTGARSRKRHGADCRSLGNAQG